MERDSMEVDPISFDGSRPCYAHGNFHGSSWTSINFVSGGRLVSKPEFCSQHPEDGMLNVINKRCGHLDGNKRPSYGKPVARNTPAGWRGK